MKNRIEKSKTILCFCFVLSIVLSCLQPAATRRNTCDAIDSLLESRKDSVFTYPAEMEKRFCQIQQTLTDSISFYKLESSKGYCQLLQGELDKAIKTNNRALQFALQHEQTAALEAICWKHRCAMMQGMSLRDSSIACLHHAYQAIYRSDDHRELENVCILLADQYRQKGNLVNAIQYYRKALWAVDSLQSEMVRFSIYTGLGQVYADLHNFKLAHLYFDLADKNPEPRLTYENYFFHNTLGNCYFFEEKYDEALRCFREAYRIAASLNLAGINAITEANLGEIYTLTGQYDSAAVYLNKSYEFFSQTVPPNTEGVFYLSSLQAALALRKGELDAVRDYLSFPYNPQQVNPSYIYLHNKRFMEYYAQKKDYRQAYKYKLLVDTYDDSIRNVRSLNNIAEIDFRYRQDTLLLKRDIEIAQTRAQLSRQQTWITLAVALIAILCLLSVLYYIHTKKKHEKEYAQQFTLITRLRMENVKNRLSPHYIFNVLNTIMPILKQYNDLSHLLKLFIQVLQDNLQISNQIAVALQEEITLAKNYIALRKETHPHSPEVVWEVEEGIPLDFIVPSMCIQIPVENALKYAFEEWENTEKKPWIKVSIIQMEQRGIEITIRDNGCGFTPGKQRNSERSTGNGLKILYRTITLLNIKNVEKMNMQMDSVSISDGEHHGTKITIYVPFNYQFNF